MAFTLQQAIDYSKANPNSDYARQIGTSIKSGAFDQTAQNQGVDLTPFGRPKIVTPTPTQEGNFATGFGKQVEKSVTDVASMAQGVGQHVLAALPGVSLDEVKSTTGIPALDKSKPEGQNLETTLSPTNSAERSGATTEQIGELAVPFLGIVGKTIEKAPTLARALEEASMRLTPAMRRDLGTKLDDVTHYMLNNKIIGTPAERTDKINTLYNSAESTLQNFLNTNNTARGIFVSKSSLLDEVENLKQLFRNHRDLPVIQNQIDGAKDAINAIFKREKIPIARLNEFKRTTYDNAYNKAGTKVLDDVEHSIGNVAQKSIEDATKGLKIAGRDIGEFNKEYGTIINARNILKVAESRDEIGILGKIISTVVGGGFGGLFGGGPLGTGVGMLVGQQIAPIVAGTKVRSLAAAGLDMASKAAPYIEKVAPTVKNVAKVIVGKDVGNLVN